jgi:hypothetical protein
VFFSIITLFWQLFVLLACCLGVGSALRFLFPIEFSLLNEVLFSLLGGLFVAVLIPQNLVYLGVPVRISAWLLLAAALLQVWLCRHKLVPWIRTSCSNADLRTLTMLILFIITFHSIVPIRQGLGWYYGKGHFDQINYVLLAEFLKEEPYGVSEQEIGLRPWLVRPVGFQDNTGQLGVGSGPGVEMIGLKKERIGQSIITAEISVWSRTNAKAAYAATVIFFLTLLGICLYVFLRESGIDRFLAASGALLAALLPVVTQLSLDGFLSQISILFIFPFFASLLRREELSPRSFTLFFSLTLAYLVAAYSEIAPIGFCTLFLGVLFLRREKMRPKRLMLMSAILLIALVNPYYLRNLIGFLGHQYELAANSAVLRPDLAPKILTLGDWSALLFGSTTTPPWPLLFDCCTLLLGLLLLAGAITLSRREKLIIGAILLPAILVILCLATRTPPSSYPIAKITMTLLPFVISLVFIPLFRIAAKNQYPPIGAVKKLVSAFVVAAAAAGSARYYSEVLDNGDLLRYLREPRFLEVCRELEEKKGKRVLVFETNPLLTTWLCYHARDNDVYFDGRLISDSPVPPNLPFSRIPDLDTVDLVATRDRIVELSAPGLSCLTSVDDNAGEDRRGAYGRYQLGPPARLRFLALRAMSATLKMRLAPIPGTTTFPIDYSLTDAQGHVLPGELWAKSVEVVRVNLPRGHSYLELSVKAKASEPNVMRSDPVLAELDGIELSDIDLQPGG